MTKHLHSGVDIARRGGQVDPGRSPKCTTLRGEGERNVEEEAGEWDRLLENV